MTKKITIAIDAMGGENSPDKTIEGVKIFIDKNKSNDDKTLTYSYLTFKKIDKT